MSPLNWISFSFLILCVIALPLIQSRRAKNAQSYFVSDRKTKLFPLTATLVMTELNTSTMVGFASLGYLYGFSAAWVAIIFLIGLSFYALTVAKKWKDFNAVSITTFFEKRYNPLIGYFAAFILIIAMLGFSANYIKSLTLIFAPLFPKLNQWELSAIFCALMALITLKGGLKSIIRIDAISFIFVLLVFPTIFYVSFSHAAPNDISHSVLRQTGFPMTEVISLTVITMFTYILAPWYGQKIFSAESRTVAFKAVLIAAVLITLIYLMSILAASKLGENSHLQRAPQEAIPYLINHRLPAILKGFAYAMIFFIATTTLAALWNTISSVFIAHHDKNPKNKSLKISIIMTAVIGLITYLLANLFVNKVFEKMILMNIPIAALAFSVLGGFYWKKVSPIASFLSILTGVVGGVFCYLYFGEPEYMWYWAVYVIPLEFLVGIIFTLLFPKTTNKNQL